MDLTALFNRRRRAEAALDNPGVKEAIDSLRKGARMAIERSEPHQQELREESYRTIRNLHALERELARFIAAHELEKRKLERSSSL